MSRRSAHPVVGEAHTIVRFTTPNWYTTGSLQIAVVTAISGGTKHWVRVAFTGAHDKTGFTATKTTVKVRYLASYTPTVGDVVMVHRGQGRQNKTRYVVGKLA